MAKPSIAEPSDKPSDGSSATWLSSYVHEWMVEPDAEKRKTIAKSLMAYAGASMKIGRPLDQSVMKWIGERLSEAAFTGNADRAFALKAGRGKRAEPREQLNAAMELHVAKQWISTNKNSIAAAAVEVLANRVTAANLIKHYKSVLRHWSIAGPFVMGEDGNPITCKPGTRDDLLHGLPLGVEFRAKLSNTNRYVLYVPDDLKDL